MITSCRFVLEAITEPFFKLKVVTNLKIIDSNPKERHEIKMFFASKKYPMLVGCHIVENLAGLANTVFEIIRNSEHAHAEYARAKCPSNVG